MKKILNLIHESSLFSDSFSVLVENIYAALRGRAVRFYFESPSDFFVRERGFKIKISNKSRGFWLYRNGIENRKNFIFQSYCLQNIEFYEGDVVFDCGANSGDLFLKLRDRIGVSNYYAFEPNPLDFHVLMENVGIGANIFNYALGCSDGELSFFVSTRGGDSSLIEPKAWDEKITVPVRRLDSFIDEKKFDILSF